MKNSHFIAVVLTKIGLQANAIIQISKVFAYSATVGPSASSILMNHGITQPVFGVLSLAASVPLELKIIKHYLKPLPSPSAPKEITKMLSKMKEMEKKYGIDWMDRVATVADTVAKLNKKK